RLGEHDLAINASGAGLKVRIGADETTIPLSQESEHERLTNRARGSDRRAAQAPGPATAEVGEALDGARCGGTQPLPAGAVGALRGDAGERRDRAGEDLARDVLPSGDAGVAR